MLQSLMEVLRSSNTTQHTVASSRSNTLTCICMNVCLITYNCYACIHAHTHTCVYICTTCTGLEALYAHPISLKIKRGVHTKMLLLVSFRRACERLHLFQKRKR